MIEKSYGLLRLSLHHQLWGSVIETKGANGYGGLPFFEDKGRVKTEVVSIDHFNGQVYNFCN